MAEKEKVEETKKTGKSVKTDMYLRLCYAEGSMTPSDQAYKIQVIARNAEDVSRDGIKRIQAAGIEAVYRKFSANEPIVLTRVDRITLEEEATVLVNPATVARVIFLSEESKVMEDSVEETKVPVEENKGVDNE